MYGTMQDFPLTITAIMRHGCGVHGRRTVTTATGEGYRHSSYRDVGQRAGQLANALRRLGVTGDQRVATFMWNNTEHLVTYFAVPSMGAVLHTLNIRLFPEQIAYVTNEAEDRVILVDLSLARLLAPVLPKLDTVHTVIAVGEGDTTPLREAGKTVLRFAELIDAESPDFGWPQIDENSAAAMCYTSGTTGNPKGVVYSHRSSFLHTMAACTTNGIGVGSSDKVLPIVPMFHANGWGLPYAALMAGADLVLPDRHLDARSLIHMVETLKPTLAGAVPTIWNDVMHYLEKDPDHDMSSLRLVACGGSAVPESLMRTFEDKHDVQIRQLWGMTETSPLATMAWPPPGTPDDQHWAARADAKSPIFVSKWGLLRLLAGRKVTMSLRVIQWATGSVGVAAIKGVLQHPELELVGCWVHSAAKSGKDVGEIIGSPPLGVIATNSIDDVLALDADAVIYAPLLPSVDEVAALLRSGKNVVTPLGWFYPSEKEAAPLEVAAQAGNATLHGAGIGPGAVTELFPLLLSVMSTGVTFVRSEEFSDLRSYGAPDVLRYVMGFGGTPDSALTGPMQKILDGGFLQSVRLCVDRLGFAADPQIRTSQEVAVATAPIDSPIGVIEPGQVAGRRFHWEALVEDTVVVQIAVNWLMGSENLDPPWSFGPAGERYEIEVRGSPDTCVTIKGWQPQTVAAGLKSNPGIVATAAHCVNAIPATCAAPAGIQSFFDLPLITGRAAPGLAR